MDVSGRLDTCDESQENVEPPAGGGKGKDRSEVKINEYEAAWNVTTAIQDMFYLCLPFAVLRGGYWALIIIVGIACVCCYTGKILVQCLYEPDPATGEMVRVRDSYAEIAKVCFGPKYGAQIVNFVQIIELLMLCILYVVVCGDLLALNYPEGPLDPRSWMIITGIFLLPLSFVKSLWMVSLLSFCSTISHLVINVLIVGYCLLEIGNWGWSTISWSIDFESISITFGIIAFSYSSQVFLPVLEGNMKDRSKFNWMLNWSYIAAAIFKVCFGYICFLTFQQDTQQVITNNLLPKDFKGIVNIFVVAKAITSYPLPYYTVCNLLEKNFFFGPPETKCSSIWEKDGRIKLWGLFFRVSIIIGTILISIFIPYFSILIGIISSFTAIMLSFIWPCYFHIKIKGHCLDKKIIAYDCFIILFGVLFCSFSIYDSRNALIEAFENGLPF